MFGNGWARATATSNKWRKKAAGCCRGLGGLFMGKEDNGLTQVWLPAADLPFDIR
jgi:hypothetical protein